MKKLAFGLLILGTLQACGSGYHELTETLGAQNCRCEADMVALAQKTSLAEIEAAWPEVIKASLACMGEKPELKVGLLGLKAPERMRVMEELPRYEAEHCPEVKQAKDKLNALLSR